MLGFDAISEHAIAEIPVIAAANLRGACLDIQHELAWDLTPQHELAWDLTPQHELAWDLTPQHEECT